MTGRWQGFQRRLSPKAARLQQLFLAQGEHLSFFLFLEGGWKENKVNTESFVKIMAKVVQNSSVIETLVKHHIIIFKFYNVQKAGFYDQMHDIYNCQIYFWNEGNKSNWSSTGTLPLTSFLRLVVLSTCPSGVQDRPKSKLE